MKQHLLLVLILLASPHLAIEAFSQTSTEAAKILSDATQARDLAQIANVETMQWGLLKAGVDIYSDTDRYQWEEIPEDLIGIRFLQHPKHQGVLTFSVESSGLVFIATSTRWNSGGNSSGDWQEEVMLEKDLRRNGWRKVRAFDDLTSTDPGEMAVFFRFCQAGESFRIRTEKYVAPILLIR